MRCVADRSIFEKKKKTYRDTVYTVSILVQIIMCCEMKTKMLQKIRITMSVRLFVPMSWEIYLEMSMGLQAMTLGVYTIMPSGLHSVIRESAIKCLWDKKKYDSTYSVEIFLKVDFVYRFYTRFYCSLPFPADISFTGW